MKKFLTLIEIEFRHMIGILVGIFVATAGLSVLIFYSGISSANQQAQRIMAQGSMSVAAFTAQNGYFSLANVTNNAMLYLVFILFFFGLVLALSFWVWQREWAGKSKGIYFLLSLRAPRIRILAVKLLVTVFCSWLFFGMILIILGIGSLMMNVIMGSSLVASNQIATYLQNANWALSIALPTTFTHFLYHTIFTITIFLAMTAWVLLTKSFKWLGGVIGFIYCVANLIIFIRIQTMWLFYDERILIEWTFVIGSCLISFLLNYWLINKTISV